MALSQDIKERIFAAADVLHAESATGEFPSVEAVRQASRSGMNNVVEAMKEWRQNQRKQVQTVREPLPVELHSVVQAMGQSLWETAQQLANESLDAAKVAFETEKSDLIQLSAEQSESFEAQGRELDSANERIDALNQQLMEAAADARQMTQKLEEVRNALTACEQKAALAEQRAEDVERRATDLRAELDHAHTEAEAAAVAAKALALQVAQQLDEARAARADAEQKTALTQQKAGEAERRATDLRAELDHAHTERDKAQALHDQVSGENTKLADRLGDSQKQVVELQAALASERAKAEAVEQSFVDQRKRAADEVHRSAERMAKAETARDKAREEAATAREDAATLRGELEATKTQNVGLLAALKPTAKPPKPGKD